jgi:HSP20 family protein
MIPHTKGAMERGRNGGASRLSRMAGFRSIKLRWLQGQLREIAYEHSQAYLAPYGPRRWRPAINAFRCDQTLCICVDLAGVERAQIDLTFEPGRLVLRGTRSAPEPLPEKGRAVRVLALEIDSGEFERELALPPDVASEGITAEQQNGLLWIHLPIRS